MLLFDADETDLCVMLLTGTDMPDEAKQSVEFQLQHLLTAAKGRLILQVLDE